MTAKLLRIGGASRATGLTIKAIRFYEDRGYVRAMPRNEAGYRQYDRSDINRLLLIKRARQLGMGLQEIGSLLAQASGDCGELVGRLSLLVAGQRRAIDARIAELEALRGDLDAVELHLGHCECAPGVRFDDCDYCLIPETPSRVNCAGPVSMPDHCAGPADEAVLPPVPACEERR